MSEIYNAVKNQMAILESGETGYICGYNPMNALLVISITDGMGVPELEGAVIVTHKDNQKGYLYANLDDVIICSNVN